MSGPTTRRFPRLRARDLERTARTVPDDLDGSPRVLLVAFDRFHQRIVDAWVRVLEERGRASAPGMRIYEIPTIGTRWRWARGFIDGGMVAAIPDRDVRRRTLTAYTDVARVLRALDLPDASRPCAVVLDDAGGIVALAVGGPEEDDAHAVLDALSSRGAA